MTRPLASLLAGLLATGCSCGDPTLGGADGGTRDGSTRDGSARDGSGGGGGDGGRADAAGGGAEDAGECGTLLAVVRDFEASHSDFEAEVPGHVTGLVEDTLDAERKPVFAHGARRGAIESVDSFRQWYRDVPGVNQAFEIPLPLTDAGGGTFVYDSAAFFPLDGRGFGNSGTDSGGVERNFHFTTELHTGFVYEGGEVFTFRGDDDLWLFIDGRLVIDLGGVHGAVEDTVALDDLGLTPGERYNMDIFHAERHTVESNFRLETTIRCFVDPILI